MLTEKTQPSTWLAKRDEQRGGGGVTYLQVVGSCWPLMSKVGLVLTNVPPIVLIFVPPPESISSQVECPM